MEIKALLFDKDGTLIDFAKTFAPATKMVIEDLSNGNVALATQLAHAADYNMQTNEFGKTSVIIAGSVEDIAKTWLPFVPIDLHDLTEKTDKLFLKYTTKTIYPFDFLIPTLEKLHARGIILGIATNDSQQGGETHMNAIGVRNFFTHIFGYDSGYGAKPSGGMIHAFADKIGLPVENIAMVGDSNHDMLAGKDAGAITIAVRSGSGGELAQADYMLNDIAEIISLIK